MNPPPIQSPFAGAKLPTSGMTYVEEGVHQAALAKISYGQKEGKQPMYRADFVVISSDNPKHRVDDDLTMFFRPYAAEYPGAGQKEMGRLLDLLNKLFNQTMSPEQAELTLASMLTPEQPARGLRVEIKGYLVVQPDGQPKLNKKGNKIINTAFEQISNSDAQELAATRAHIMSLPKFAQTAPAEPAPAPVAQPAPAAAVAVAVPGVPLPGQS